MQTGEKDEIKINVYHQILIYSSEIEQLFISEIERKKKRYADRQIYIYRQIERQIDRYVDRQINKQVDREREKGRGGRKIKNAKIMQKYGIGTKMNNCFIIILKYGKGTKMNNCYNRNVHE